MQTIGKSFVETGFAVKEEKPIFVKIGMNYESGSNLWTQETTKQWTPILEKMTEFRIMVNSWKHILGKF